MHKKINKSAIGPSEQKIYDKKLKFYTKTEKLYFLYKLSGATKEEFARYYLGKSVDTFNKYSSDEMNLPEDVITLLASKFSINPILLKDDKFPLIKFTVEDNFINPSLELDTILGVFNIVLKKLDVLTKEIADLKK
jgi:hypothetical protein